MKRIFYTVFVLVILSACTTSANEDAQGNYYYIPTAFSPNGDGLNDRWCIYEMSPYIFTSFHLQVRDAAFLTVYENDDAGVCWDGRSNNVLLPAGVYYYTLRTTMDIAPEEYQKTGSVEIIY